MKRAAIIYLLAFILPVALISCSQGFPPEFPAGDFTLKSPMTNSVVSLNDLKGSPFIIYWFTSW